MNIRTLFLTISFVLVTLCSGCSNKSSSAAESVSEKSDSIIIIYYSQTGATKAVADEIRKHLNCDIAAIEAVVAYDGTYDETVARWRAEMKDSIKVEIKPLDIDMEKYNTIFLGFPIWGGTYASPVATFLADSRLDNKNIVTFATFGSGGLQSATANAAKVRPEAVFVAGYGVRNARIGKSKNEIYNFLVRQKFIDGTVEELPEFSETRMVTDEERAIFDEACGSYKFPLGTPVSVRSRNIIGGTEYLYEAETKLPGRSLITVIAPENGEPEFTEVIRQ